MVRNNLFMDKQYAYKKAHSTELLLVKVVNEFESFDKNTRFFYKKNFYKKTSLKNVQNLRKA